eukprot:8560081-Pyramimonas_sp.AAC.1
MGWWGYAKREEFSSLRRPGGRINRIFTRGAPAGGRRPRWPRRQPPQGGFPPGAPAGTSLKSQTEDPYWAVHASSEAA